MSLHATAQAQTLTKPIVAPVTSGILQRACACGKHSGNGGECEECKRKREGTLQRAALRPSTVNEVPPIVHEVLRSSGQPLDTQTRAFMEPRFGHDFSGVRVHTDSKAAESARAVNAQAYTVGQNVVFGPGRYVPSTSHGLRLMAHELAHTLQQHNTIIQPSLEIASVDDASEFDAEQAALTVVNGSHLVPTTLNYGHSVLNRTPDESLQTDVAHLPAPAQGDQARIHVVRKLMPCECRNVPDVREGVFYNPDVDAFAIAYRHCRGGTTTDIYGQVESNLSSFLSGGPPPAGTARIGFEINVVGRSVSGRAVVEVLGSNVSGGEGIGGRAQVVFQGNQWRVFVTADFLHGIGANPGDSLQLNLGARIGSVTAEVQVTNALTSAPTVTGAGCIDIFGGSARICGTVTTDGSGGVTPGIDIRVPLGGPEVRREECFQCLCPPPRKVFNCYLDIPPSEREVTRQIDVEVPHEHRYYFRLDQVAPSNDTVLAAQNGPSLDAVAREVAAGGTISAVSGYASPEATEAHNHALSSDRATRLIELLRSRLPANTPLPPPSPGGELLGHRPSPSPGSRLGEAIRDAGIRSAEDISIFLFGEEIPHSELSEQFVSLFRALPEPTDRLALFGIDTGDPLAPHVQTAIEAFLRNPRAGSRPWERLFRLLRVGVIRTTIPERRSVTETEHDSGSVSRLSETECNVRGAEAEQQGLLPPVPPNMRSPRRGQTDRDIECRIEVSDDDRRGGCSYNIPSNMRRGATAPARAPRPFP